DLESWELFPADLQEMVNWADVYKDHEKKDLSRNHFLIYKHVEDSESSTIYPVAIRIHGILERFRIERFGNWSGCSIHYCLLRRSRTTLGRDHHISESRLSIYAPNKSKEPVLTPDDDPEGKFQCLQESWDVMRPLHVADLCANGKKVPINSVLLTAGDFVEVGAELDFVLNKNKDAKTTLKCFLACTYIVRLMPAVHVQNAQLVRAPKNGYHARHNSLSYNTHAGQQ
ncbi:hypothetical protein DEU56DRAFT_729791, partial [Suillus clintonianus]|uniref:uncharacterized protein n=1 Tax=Suillus clintonianus TaxID=1904413 RepID=UPI001B85BD38